VQHSSRDEGKERERHGEAVGLGPFLQKKRKEKFPIARNKKRGSSQEMKGRGLITHLWWGGGESCGEWGELLFRLHEGHFWSAKGSASQRGEDVRGAGEEKEMNRVKERGISPYIINAPITRATGLRRGRITNWKGKRRRISLIVVLQKETSCSLAGGWKERVGLQKGGEIHQAIGEERTPPPRA